MKSIRFIILILLFTHTSYLTHAQCSNLSVNAGTNANLVTETLYEENFSAQNDKGAFGSSIDVAGCTWTVDVSNATLSTQRGKYKIYKIDISNYTTKFNLECTLKCFRSIFLA